MKSYLVKLLTAVNILIIVGMLLVGSADFVDPRNWPLLSTVGYFFPFFVFANVVMIAVWACVKKTRLLVPFLGFVVCYLPMRKYMPLHYNGDVPVGCLKVMTYNVWAFCNAPDNTDERPLEERRREMLSYIADSKCDIVAIQEGSYGGDLAPLLDSIIRPVYQYMDSCMHPRGTVLVLFSKYPILRHEKIEYESAGNLSAAFYLSVNGKELIVVNNHLETTNFSVEERRGFAEVVRGDWDSDELKAESKFVLRKLGDQSAKRASQADAVARFVRMHKGRSMIVCGDFNDIPISYVRRTIAKDLTDCYTATGNGPGYSYHKNMMYVRIDNMMCSDDMQPYSCHVDKTCSLSDHYPMVSWVKWHGK